MVGSISHLQNETERVLLTARGCYGWTYRVTSQCSESECFKQQKPLAAEALMLCKTCLVVSKNKVPARIQRCIGSAGVEEIAEEK